ncbi:MAG TPA: hypothetical protein VEU11_05135 [Terriglobales bacterium]|nr:hypothetical protein [Terriglobales bacterium]
MRSYSCLIELILAGLLSLSYINAQTLDRTDETAIRTVVTAVPEALNHKDMAEVASYDTPASSPSQND